MLHRVFLEEVNTNMTASQCSRLSEHDQRPGCRFACLQTQQLGDTDALLDTIEALLVRVFQNMMVISCSCIFEPSQPSLLLTVHILIGMLIP